MNRIEVSVILPVFNGQKFIKETMNSVLKQSLKTFELIIINDASTDETEKVIQSYNDRRIIYRKLANNRGVANARNVGIKLAQGKFIAFIDSDDCWDKNKLQQQLRFMKENGINFSYSVDCKINPNAVRTKKISFL